MTPLHLASRQGHLPVAELLLTKGANINARYGILGWTPLFFAESVEMADLLKSYGASNRMYWWATIISG
jgi:ankyrin repeat protein